MVKIPTVRVPEQVLSQVFRKLDIWTLIERGDLTTDAVPSSVTPSRVWSDATSVILKHSIRGDPPKHVATTHRVTRDADGHIYHWDAEDLIVVVPDLANRREAKLFRIGHDLPGRSILTQIRDVVRSAFSYSKTP